MFKVGEKIVCIDDSEVKTPQLRGRMIVPLKNEIYTIRSFKSTSDGYGITLEEIINQKVKFLDGISEPVYDPARFRKLDHDFAENLLNKIKEEVLAH